MVFIANMLFVVSMVFVVNLANVLQCSTAASFLLRSSMGRGEGAPAEGQWARKYHAKIFCKNANSRCLIFCSKIFCKNANSYRPTF